jgi:hypothetical protein
VGLLQIFVPVVAGKVHDWIESQHAEHLAGARPLTDREGMALSVHFAAETLAQARVARVERVPSPAFFGGILKQLEFIGKRVHFNFAAAAGITFGECILIVDPGVPINLLFHEMVHVEQYRILGMKEFARAYVQGIVDSNFMYEQIPLEAIAFEMTARFKAGETVMVSAELQGWLRKQGYL